MLQYSLKYFIKLKKRHEYYTNPKDAEWIENISNINEALDIESISEKVENIMTLASIINNPYADVLTKAEKRSRTITIMLKYIFTFLVL